MLYFKIFIIALITYFVWELLNCLPIKTYAEMNQQYHRNKDKEPLLQRLRRHK